ncbi:MAG: hypothetical protein HY796_03060 [Elusimicrobia bacterium]|nr:hypothetical protein [Elusimicrobiota bacterium]
MKTSQFTFYLAAAADRLIRNACMKAAIRLSRLLKFLGAKKAAAGLLQDATLRFPVGARGDFGEKDLRIFGTRPDELIAEYAHYLKREGRDHGRAPTHLPRRDILKAHGLMYSHKIFDPLSKLALTSPFWSGFLLLAVCGQAIFFAAAGKEEAARVTGIIFFLGCIAVAILWRLREKFLAWMTMSLFYAASRKLEHEAGAAP